MAERPRWGFWKCLDRLRLDGHPFNHKRVHRVYCEMKLNMKRRTKKRVITRPRQPLDCPKEINETWSLDFMRDTLYDGRLDNGPELASEFFTGWAQEHGIKLRSIQPGKPNQNAFIERFNKGFRDEVLDAHLFNTLSESQEDAEIWLEDYNEYRPHESLGRLPPAIFKPRLCKPETSTSGL